MNSPLIADTKSYYIPGGGLNAIGQMAIEKIEMQATTPNKNEIKVNTTDIKSSFGKNSKLITTINNNLGDSQAFYIFYFYVCYIHNNFLFSILHSLVSNKTGQFDL